MKKEVQKRITVMEAVDNLSSMVEIDQGISPEQLREQALHAPEGDGEGKKALRWIDPKRGAVSKEEIKETLRALYDYFEELYTQKSEELQDPETQRGVQAIMLLVAEAGKNSTSSAPPFKENTRRGLLSSTSTALSSSSISLRFCKNLSKKSSFTKSGRRSSETLSLKFTTLKNKESKI